MRRIPSDTQMSMFVHCSMFHILTNIDVHVKQHFFLDEVS